MRRCSRHSLWIWSEFRQSSWFDNFRQWVNSNLSKTPRDMISGHFRPRIFLGCSEESGFFRAKAWQCLCALAAIDSSDQLWTWSLQSEESKEKLLSEVFFDVIFMIQRPGEIGIFHPSTIKSVDHQGTTVSTCRLAPYPEYPRVKGSGLAMSALSIIQQILLA